jgi:hypothetical protein
MRRLTALLMFLLTLLLLLSPVSAQALAEATVPSQSSSRSKAKTQEAKPQEARPQQARPVILRRDPKIVDVELEVALTLFDSPVLDSNGVNVVPERFRFPSIEVAIPVLTRTSWFDTDFAPLAASVFVDGRESKLEAGKVFSKTGAGVEALLRFQGTVDQPATSLRFVGRYSTQRWKLEIDRERAAQATWPREWPQWTQRYLGKELGIDPEDPVTKEVAEKAIDGGARSVTPYVAAQGVIQRVLGRWRAMTGAGSELAPDGSLRGMRFTTGESPGLAVGRGTPVELATTCVSALRAIGIPSRIVYGITDANLRQRDRGDEDERRSRARGGLTFRYICEFYLPEIGWIPFDPIEMRGAGAGSRTSIGPIKGFADVTDIEAVLPLAVAPVPVGFERADRYAVWGWKIGGGSVIDSEQSYSGIKLRETGRGNGKPPVAPAPTQDETP